MVVLNYFDNTHTYTTAKFINSCLDPIITATSKSLFELRCD